MRQLGPVLTSPVPGVKERGGGWRHYFLLGVGRRFSYSSLSFWSVGSRGPFWHHLLRLPGAANPRSQWPHLAPDRQQCDGHDDSGATTTSVPILSRYNIIV